MKIFCIVDIKFQIFLKENTKKRHTSHLYIPATFLVFTIHRVNFRLSFYIKFLGKNLLFLKAFLLISVRFFFFQRISYFKLVCCLLLVYSLDYLLQHEAVRPLQAFHQKSKCKRFVRSYVNKFRLLILNLQYIDLSIASSFSITRIVRFNFMPSVHFKFFIKYLNIKANIITLLTSLGL